ncbi:MAG: MMPL family transporter [Pseudomonadota bacterium]
MIIEKCVVSVIESVKKVPRATLLACALLCVLSIVAAVSYLRVNTDSSEMLSNRLDFQIRTKGLNNAFPGIKNSIVVIVRSGTPDATVDVASRLVARLESETDAVDAVFSSASDPFFLTNGLLYRDVEELERDLEAINNAASFLAELRDSRTFDTLALSLQEALVLADKAEFDREFLERFFQALAAVISARLDEDPQTFSWLDAMAAEPDEADRQTILFVTPKLDFASISPARAARQAVEAAIADVREAVTFPVEIDITGDPILRGDELRSVAGGIEISLVLSLVATFGLLILAYRSLARALVTMTGLIVTLILTTGFAALAVGALNLVSIAFCVLLIGLGLDFSIHVLAHIEEKARLSGDTAHALSDTARAIGTPLLLSAITTALAFFAFIPTDFTGMSQLGMIGGAGVLIAFMVSVTVIPALITLLPKAASRRLWADHDVHTGLLKGSADGASRGKGWRHRGAAIAILATVCLAALFVPQARFDADPMGLRSPDSPSVKALGPLYADPDNAPYRMSAVVENREAAVALSERLEALAPVHKAISLDSFVPEDQDLKLQIIEISYPSFIHIVEGEGLDLADPEPGVTPVGGLINALATQENSPGSDALRAALERLPADPAASGVTAGLERDIFIHFQPLIDRFRLQLDIDTVTLDRVPGPLVERFRDTEGAWRVEALPTGDIRQPAVLDTFVDAVLGVSPEAAGAPLQIMRAGEVVAEAMLQATAAAFVMVGVLCFLILRSPVMVFAVLLPLFAAATLTLGGSVVLGIPFNYANIIVLPLLIGIGVDSGIHLAMRRRSLTQSADLYRTSTPRAVLFSALTTIAAFASLGLSEHRGTASMGHLLTLAIGCTLICTIVLTPILLDLFYRNRTQVET